MITFEMNVIPYGIRLAGEHAVLNADVWTDGDRHAYRLRLFKIDADVAVLEGDVAKERSGHRNPLHLLRAVLADVDLDALGLDYVTTWPDLTAEARQRLLADKKRNPRNDPDLAEEIVGALEVLAGRNDWAGIDRAADAIDRLRRWRRRQSP